MADINFGKSDFQFAQLDEEFKPCIASILNQNYKTQDWLKGRYPSEHLVNDVSPLQSSFSGEDR